MHVITRTRTMIAAVIALALCFSAVACTSDGDNTSVSSPNGASVSETNSPPSGADLTALRRPGTLDEALPAALDGLHPVLLEESEPARYFTTMYTRSTTSNDVRASILVSTRESPVTADTARTDAELYPSPGYTYTPVPSDRRASFGQHSFVTASHDDLDEWALTADTLFVKVKYQPGSVSETELWTLAESILRAANSTR